MKKNNKNNTFFYSILLTLGPAFIAAIGYIDPGNFVTDIEAGSKYGYDLLWVVLWANIAAMLIQYVSSKIGVATGKNMGEIIKEKMPTGIAYLYWVIMEIIAMATDLAETLGAALGISLITHLSIPISFIIAIFVSYILLVLLQRQQRAFEIFTFFFLLFVALIYASEVMQSHPNWHTAALGGLIPKIPDSYSLYLLSGIIGATIMPHVIFLHSHLTKRLFRKNQHKIIKKGIKIDIFIAMIIAGFVNLAILIVAAAVFYKNGIAIDDIRMAYKTLSPLLGESASFFFGLALVLSGLSSTLIGTLAGQVILQSFIKFRIPLWIRRTSTLLPSVAVVALGLSITKILILSQVILSMGLILIIIPLVLITRSKTIMHDYTNAWYTTYLVLLIGLASFGFNIVYIVESLF